MKVCLQAHWNRPSSILLQMSIACAVPLYYVLTIIYTPWLPCKVRKVFLLWVHRLIYIRLLTLFKIPEWSCSTSHNAPLRPEMCTFLFWMEHCGIWNRCILWFVKLVYYYVCAPSNKVLTDSAVCRSSIKPYVSSIITGTIIRYRR